jgi:RHS repeat-associated protein
VGVAGKRSISAVCFGGCLQSQGDLVTDKLFTGQRRDDTGLYYYGARYYDPTIGRFVSPDTIVQNYTNPQCFNRYSYVLNNPLKYVDPTGMKFDVNYDNWTEQDYLNWFAYGATAMPVEQAYQNMMNDPDLPIEEKSNLQMLHDADNIIAEFGKYSDKTIESLSNVTKIVNELPAYYNEKSMDRRYQYYGKDWYYHYGLRNDSQFDWEGLGKAWSGAAGLITGTAIGLTGLGISYTKFIPGNVLAPFSALGGPIFGIGWDIFDNTISWMSDGQFRLPDIPWDF